MKAFKMKQWMGIGCGILFAAALTAAAEPIQNEVLRSEICLNGTWQLTVDGIDKPADVRVPGSFADQDQLWGKDHWDVWGFAAELRG